MTWAERFRVPRRFAHSLGQAPYVGLVMSSSVAPECNEVKERYDSCFLKWYSESKPHYVIVAARQVSLMLRI